MYAIIGATGKVGSATARTLRERGEPVRAIVRDPEKAGELQSLGCEIAVADVHDAPALRAAIDGASAVQVICPLDLKAEPAPAAFELIIDTIAAAVAAAKPERVLAISDYGAHLDVDTGITNTFHYLEEKLGDFPGTVTFVRSAEHMQNLSRVARAAMDSGVLPTLHSPLDKVFPTVSAYDVGVISAELFLSPNPPRIVHAEGPRRYTALVVAEMIGEIIGRSLRAAEIPRSDWEAGLARAGMSPSYVRLVTQLYDVHNTGAIDAEAGVGEVRRGTTDLRDVLQAVIQNA